MASTKLEYLHMCGNVWQSRDSSQKTASVEISSHGG